MADVNYTKPGEVPSVFWAAALRANQTTGIDPYLVAAIGKLETTYGTALAGKQGYSMGYSYTGPGQGNPKYQDIPGSFDVQTMAAAKQIKAYMGNIPVTAISLRDLQLNSWKPGDDLWSAKVWEIYKGLNKNIDPVLNWGSDPVGALEDVKSGAIGIASGVVYILMLLVIAGVGLFAGAKMFSSKG